MESAECSEKLPHYSSKELLELLSLYEGELQARDALLELIQQQQQGISASSHSLDLPTSHSSSTAVPTTATSTGNHQQMGAVGEPFSALLRDSQLTDSEHAGECTMCGNALLRSAKIVQMQRMCERKMGKAIVLLGKRYTEVQQELGGRQRRIELMAVENGRYVRDLEAERDELLEQLIKCKTELAELFEQRVDVEDKLEGERERTRLMVLHLVDERKSMLAEARKQQQQQQKEQEAQRVAAAAAINSSHHGSKSIDGGELGDVHQQKIRRLSDENARLLSTVSGLQVEKAALKKRLDQLLRDLQQQNASNCLPQQQHQLHFLQSSKALPASKEQQQQQQQQQLITLRDNGLILCPPPHSLDKQPQHGHQRHQKQQQQQQLFPPLPPTSSISSSSSQQSFPTTTPPRPTIRPSSSFPLHLGASPQSSSSIDAGGGKQQRPTTAPEGNRRAKTTTATVMGGIHRTHQFPVTESDWTTVDHRVVVPLMGTHSANNFPRSSAARTHPAPVPRTSVTTIARSPQHRRTTMGGSIEQRIGGGGQGQQQSQVAITRRSSSLPRRILVGGGPTTTTSAPPPQHQQQQQMPVPNSVRQQQQQLQQQRPVVIQQQQKQPTPVTGSRHFFYQPSSALIGGDKYSNFL
uniref:Cortactin-binding protein-2 N-terminal domain-containing protein n=1 Tax=Globodera rostochiensis TaxID=31243 RepID=A0A914IBY4_GLORO